MSVENIGASGVSAWDQSNETVSQDGSFVSRLSDKSQSLETVPPVSVSPSAKSTLFGPNALQSEFGVGEVGNITVEAKGELGFPSSPTSETINPSVVSAADRASLRAAKEKSAMPSEFATLLTGISNGLAVTAQGNSSTAAASKLTGQIIGGVQVADAVMNGKPLASSVIALGNTLGASSVVTPAANLLQVVSGQKSLTDAKDVLTITKDVAGSIGGKDGQNISEAAGVGLAVQKTLGSDLGSAGGIQNALGVGSAVANLFDNSRLAQGANTVSQAVGVINAPNVGNVLNLGASVLSLAGADPGVTNTVATVAGAITNPVGTAIGAFVGGLADAFKIRPNESKLPGISGVVKGTDSQLNVITAAPGDQGQYALTITQPNVDRISESDLGPSVLREGQFITNGGTRATMSDNGLLQLQKETNGKWQTTYQAGLPLSNAANSVAYVDQKDGRTKIAIESSDASGTKSYTPIWQSDRAADTSTGQTLSLRVNGSDLHVGTDGRKDMQLLNRALVDGWFLNIGSYYNREDNGQVIAQKGAAAFETKGDYGRFDDAKQAPNLQGVDPKLGIYDVQFKDQAGADKELVRQQRNAQDLAKNSSLAFLEVQDTKYTPLAENFSSGKIISVADAAAGIRAGKLQDVTDKINYQPKLLDAMNGARRNTPESGRGIVDVGDGKKYHVYADKDNVGAAIKVETDRSLDREAFSDINVSKLPTRREYQTLRTYHRSSQSYRTDVYTPRVDHDIAAGKIREISAAFDRKALSASPLLNVSIGRGGGQQPTDRYRVFQASDGTVFKTMSSTYC